MRRHFSQKAHLKRRATTQQKRLGFWEGFAIAVQVGALLVLAWEAVVIHKQFEEQAKQNDKIQIQIDANQRQYEIQRKTELVETLTQLNDSGQPKASSVLRSEALGEYMALANPSTLTKV